MTVKTKNFSLDTDPKLACTCGCGVFDVKQHALDKLQALRNLVGRPLSITSGYRCENHPNEKRKAKPGTHNQGIAFDIAVSNGAERRELVDAALKLGFGGIGVARSFVHVDTRETTVVMWTY